MNKNIKSLNKNSKLVEFLIYVTGFFAVIFFLVLAYHVETAQWSKASGVLTPFVACLSVTVVALVARRNYLFEIYKIDRENFTRLNYLIVITREMLNLATYIRKNLNDKKFSIFILVESVNKMESYYKEFYKEDSFTVLKPETAQHIQSLSGSMFGAYAFIHQLSKSIENSGISHDQFQQYSGIPPLEPFDLLVKELDKLQEALILEQQEYH